MLSNSTENLRGPMSNGGIESGNVRTMQPSASVKSLGGSLSVSSLLSVASDTSGPLAVAPPSSSPLLMAEAAAASAFTAKPSLGMGVPTMGPARPVGLQYPRAKGSLSSSGSNIALQFGQVGKAHQYQTMHASPSAEKLHYMPVQSQVAQVAFAQGGKAEQYQTMHASLSAEKLQYMPVQPPVTQVACSQPTWVIEEVIDFDIPYAEPVHEVENFNVPNGCIPLMTAARQAGFFNSCVLRTCEDDDEEVAKAENDFC